MAQGADLVGRFAEMSGDFFIGRALKIMKHEGLARLPGKLRSGIENMCPLFFLGEPVVGRGGGIEGIDVGEGGGGAMGAAPIEGEMDGGLAGLG